MQKSSTTTYHEHVTYLHNQLLVIHRSRYNVKFYIIAIVEPVQGISTGVLLSLYSMFVNGLTWYILSTPLLLAAFPSTIIDIVSVNAVTDADIYYEHRRCNFHRGRDHPQTDPFINFSIAPQSENK
ncbi:hypothetical protein GQX74_014968 [Glossina fuscipes]|nr:hypothetical protein GQX74_014968 [Glossina fuscipes]